MTYIEFFDKTSVRNICSCLAAEPDKVIFVGSNQKQMKKYISRYREMFAQRGKNIDFSYRTVKQGDLDGTIELLCNIVEENPNCVFDTDGGDDIALVAVGAVYERYYDKKLITQRVNVRSNIMYQGEKEFIIPGITVAENIKIYGGNIVYDDRMAEGTHIWEYDDRFKKDIDAVWNICRKDVSLWNREVKDLQVAEKHSIPDKNELNTKVYFSDIGNRIDIKILRGLEKAGIITDYHTDKKGISFRYKNEQVKRLLLKAGQSLEMKIYSVAKSVLDDKGRPVYDDVLNGVCIDWDGDALERGESVDVENEIDVMLTKGVVPVFISCKNGLVKIDELYKLNTVARRFGGEYAKKVLVATSLEKSGEAFAQNFRDRARDMGIRILENVQYMKESELERAIKNLWRT